MYSSTARVARDALRSLLVCSLAASLVDCQTTPSISGEITTLDNLDGRQIPTAERFAWQPKEVVAVIGSHRWRHWGGTNTVAFSPDGTTVASGGEDGFVRLWDKDGRELAALNLPTRSLNALAFRPDGQVLLAGAEDGMIHTWDLRANPPAPLAPIKPPALPQRPFGLPDQPAVDAIAFAPGGKLLACSVGRQTGVRVILWDSTAWPPRELPALPGATAPFAFSADGTRLVTQEGFGDILVWDLTGERPQKKAAGKLPQPHHKKMVTMALAPDGKTLVTCHDRDRENKGEGDVILWDLTVIPPKPKAIFGSFKSEPMFYMTASAAFSPDGKTLAFSSRQRRVELWDVTANPPKQRAVLPRYVAQSGTLAFAPDGKTLASVGAGVLLWNLTESTPHLKTGRSEYLPLAVVSPDGRRLATAAEGSKEFTAITRLWDLTGAAPQPLAEPIDGVPLFFASDGILWTADNPTVEAAAAEPRQPGRAAQTPPRTLRRWEASGKELRTVGAATAPVVQLFQGSGVVTARTLLLFGEKRERERLLWRLGSRGEAKSCKLPMPRESQLHPTAASADGAVFAAGVGDYENRVIKVWDIAGETARERASLKGAAVPSRIKTANKATGKVMDEQPGEARPLRVWALAVAPDGRAVALAGADGTIQVWSLAEGDPRLRATLRGHNEERVMGAVQRLAFSGDGQRLVTIGSDRKLMVWDITAGKAVYTASFPHVMTDAGLAPDGRHVVTSNPDGTVYILRLPRTP